MLKTAVLAIAICGCTRGAVLNAAAPERGVPGARVSVSPARGGLENVATTADALLWGTDNFAFGPDPSAPSHAGGELAPNQWYRYEVTRPGFDRAVFHRYHPGYAEHCTQFECPPGASENCCHREDFELWPSETPRALLPDLIVDHEVLAAHTHFQCVDLGGDDWPEVIALRTTVRVANIGDGDLVFDTVGGGERCDAAEECTSRRCSESDRCEPVTVQRASSKRGAPETSRVVDAAFAVNRHSGAMELGGATSLRLVRQTPGCADDFRSGCVVVAADGARCVEGDDVFDSTLASDLPATRCDRAEQRLAPGHSATYRQDDPRQVLLLGTPDAAILALERGPFWLQAEVDPMQRLSERGDERGNNRATVAVAVPRFDYSASGFNDDLCRASVDRLRCPDCVAVLDCSMCQAGMRDGVLHRCAWAPNLTARQEEMCGDYPPALTPAIAVARRE